MPSKDPISTKANAWMEKDGVETSHSTPRTSRVAVERRVMSAQILRLADRLGKDPDEVAASIPTDTVRRTKYPVIEIVNEDGSRTFKHDRGIQDDGITAVR